MGQRIPAVLIALVGAPVGAVAPPVQSDAPTLLDPVVVQGQRLPMPHLRTTPPYPMSARNRWEEGCVVLRFTVRPDGKTDNFEVLESRPAGVFERSVIGTVFRWDYDPSPSARSVVETFEFRNPSLATQPRYSVHDATPVLIGFDGGMPRYHLELAVHGYQPPSCKHWK